MKFSNILPLAAAASALVLPPEQFEELEIRDSRPCHKGLITEWEEFARSLKDDLEEKAKQTASEATDEAASLKDSFYERASNAKDDLEEKSRQTVSEATDEATSLRDSFYERATNAKDWLSREAFDEARSLKERAYESASDARDWISSEANELTDIFSEEHDPHHGRGKANLTVYQLITSNPYSVQFGKLVSEFDDLVEALNSTKGNFTVFAPTDKALDKIPDDAPKPSKEQLKKFLSYHVVPDVYTAKNVIFANTAPTLLKSDSLASEPRPQRVSFKLSLRGPVVNFYSRIILAATDIFATNGVVHGIDTPLFPPIGAINEITLFPGAFSSLELGLTKTGLLDELNNTDHAGGTLFAPNNDAFAKLGPKANAFLFSPPGRKYLRALLEYHVVPENTLYSDAYYKADDDHHDHDHDHDHDRPGDIHVDLPTALKDRSLSVDIKRYGPIIVVNVNGFNRVAVSDVVAEDGVIHVMSSVIIPPKNVADAEDLTGEISVEDLTERLEPYVKNDWHTDL